MDLNLLSNACILFTIAVFSTGIPQCLQMVKQKSTNNVPFLPYIMTCFNNLVWILYSTLTGDNTVFIVNLIGVILQIVYIVVYFIYGTSKVKETQQIGVAGLCITLFWLFVRYQEDKTIASNVMGMLCTIITVLMFSSPLAELRTIVEKGSTDSMSFPLTVATFCCTILWTMYGSMVHDPYIIIPNSLGLLTSLPRFYLFAKYRKQQKYVQADVYSA